MKITDLKAFPVDCFRTNWVFVKVYTDEGLTGVGEATLEYKEHALARRARPHPGLLDRAESAGHRAALPRDLPRRLLGAAARC